MAKLATKERNKLPKSSFGLPGERKYPMPDKSHAANAKARASQAVNAGRMSKSTEANIDAKANKMLKKKEGGKVKKDIELKVHQEVPTKTKAMKTGGHVMMNAGGSLNGHKCMAKGGMC